jgi:hypothetical protein
MLISSDSSELEQPIHEALAVLVDNIPESELAALRAAVLQAAEIDDTIDGAREQWARMVTGLPAASAHLISSSLTTLSRCLTQQRRALNPEDLKGRTRLRDAIGFLYTDVMRPLWEAFPELEPPELKTDRAPSNAG